jgi:hypothetical protein
VGDWFVLSRLRVAVDADFWESFVVWLANELEQKKRTYEC